MALSNHELACVYAALILADDNIAVTKDKLDAILKSANYAIEPVWTELFASALTGFNVADLIKNIGAAPVGGGAAATTAPAAGGDDKKGGAKEAPKKEEKKEEKPDSDDEEMVSLLAKNSSPLHSRPSSRVSIYSVKISTNSQHTDIFELFIHRDNKKTNLSLFCFIDVCVFFSSSLTN